MPDRPPRPSSCWCTAGRLEIAVLAFDQDRHSRTDTAGTAGDHGNPAIQREQRLRLTRLSHTVPSWFHGSRAGCEIRFIVSDRSASGWADSPPARPAAGLQGRSRAAASSLFPRARRPSPPRARPGPTADSRLRQCRGRRSVRGRSRHRVPQRRVTNVEVSSTSCLTRGTKPASAHIAVRTLFMTERPCPKMGSGLLGRQFCGGIGSQTPWRIAMPLPVGWQISHRNGGRVFLIFVADLRTIRLCTSWGCGVSVACAD